MILQSNSDSHSGAREALQHGVKAHRRLNHFIYLALLAALTASICQSGCAGIAAKTSDSTTSNPTGNAPNATTAPSIATPPASQSITSGQAASFSVVASGTGPLSYQWAANGSAIAGAYGIKLYDSFGNDLGQWISVHGYGDQFGRQRDQQRGGSYCERDSATG